MIPSLISIRFIYLHLCTFKTPKNDLWSFRVDATSSHFTHFRGQKNMQKCKINSRNFTYDGLTFSSSFFPSGLEEVKDEI